MKRTVWKVLRKEFGGYRSAGIGPYSVYSIKYDTNGKPTFPKIDTKLFCFKRRSDARNWKRGQSHLHIFKALAENPIKASPLRSDIHEFDIMNFWQFLNQRRTKNGFDYSDISKNYVTSIPEGTVWCDSLTIIEKAR